MKTWSRTLQVEGRRIEYRVRSSTTARKLRVRVGISGVEVILPAERAVRDVERFLSKNSQWLRDQVDRVARLGHVRRTRPDAASEILLGGAPVEVHVEPGVQRGRCNYVRLQGEQLIITTGHESLTTPAASLENWLRKRARDAIEAHVARLTKMLNATPGRLYVMGQRTKWGNCSSMKNLSFNWRIVMAPEFVFRYLVTHETVHLVVPDHSRRFWLTVQSLCPDAERARGWLSANSARLMVNLDEVLSGTTGSTDTMA